MGATWVFFQTLVSSTFIAGPAALVWVGPDNPFTLWIVMGLSLFGLAWTALIPPIPAAHDVHTATTGWRGLAQRYGLPQQPSGLDHGLAYDAVAGGQVDVIDIYTTDAKIGHLGLRVLADDANHFPRYDAVLLYRLDLPQRFPQAWRAITHLEGRISSQRMIAMNASGSLWIC